MGGSREERSLTERFVRTYAQPQSEAELLVEREVFGACIGTNGYTTLAEADTLIQKLGLGPGRRLLEIGSGRGWPGVYLARESGCQLVLTDVPLTSPGECMSSAQRSGISDRSSAAVASGEALPFGEGVFDAVDHSDVFC